MLTSHCQNCGASKDPSEYALNQCKACIALNNEAQQHFATENPTATPDQLAYVGRMAMQQRAIHPGANYMDPRKFSASRGMIPIPPQGGDRGSIPNA
jgi:hypothetical protein